MASGKGAINYQPKAPSFSLQAFKHRGQEVIARVTLVNEALARVIDGDQPCMTFEPLESYADVMKKAVMDMD